MNLAKLWNEAKEACAIPDPQPGPNFPRFKWKTTAISVESKYLETWMPIFGRTVADPPPPVPGGIWIEGRAIQVNT